MKERRRWELSDRAALGIRHDQQRSNEAERSRVLRGGQSHAGSDLRTSRLG